MKKWIIPVAILGGILVLALIWFVWSMNVKNGAIDKTQAVNKEWGNVETAYQRRNDLIGNLVETVKGAANFEKSTLVEVTQARAEANSMKVDPTNATPEQLAAFSQAQSNLMGSVNKLIGNVTVERYPELKSNANFLKLQDELASTENTIQTQRTRYNEVVQEYNNYVLKWPNSMFLSGYAEKPFFKAVEGAEKPVQVKF
jgi:LemA protein